MMCVVGALTSCSWLYVEVLQEGTEPTNLWFPGSSWIKVLKLEKLFNPDKENAQGCQKMGISVISAST